MHTKEKQIEAVKGWWNADSNKPKWDKAAYGNKDTIFYAYLTQRMKKVLEFLDSLNLPKGAKVLELGYGAGQNLLEIGKRGYEIYGLDIGQGLCEAANERCKKKLKKGTFHIDVGNIESNYKYDDNIFDVVIVIGALQYLYDQNRCFKEVYRVLKPGGHFIIAQRNIYSLSSMTTSFRDFCRTCIHFFLREKYDLFPSFKSMLVDSKVLGTVFKPFENSKLLNTKFMLKGHDVWKYKIKKRVNSYYSLKKLFTNNGFTCKRMVGAFFNYSVNPKSDVRKNIKVSKTIENIVDGLGITHLQTLGRSVVLLGQKKQKKTT